MIENLDTIERAIIISKYSDEQFELLVLRPDYGHRIVEPSFQSSLTWPGHTVEQALEISPFLRHNSVATLSCTFRSKLTHMQLLTLPPLPIFLFIMFHWPTLGRQSLSLPALMYISS